MMAVGLTTALCVAMLEYIPLQELGIRFRLGPPQAIAPRDEALVGQGRLSRDYGTNLAEAFRLCMRLRLRSQLQEGDGRVRVADLGPAERDLLRHALHQVKKFQQWLTLHFRLRQ